MPSEIIMTGRTRAALEGLSSKNLSRVHLIAERHRLACQRLGIIPESSERERVLVEAAEMVRAGTDKGFDAPNDPYQSPWSYGVYAAPTEARENSPAAKPKAKAKAAGRK